MSPLTRLTELLKTGTEKSSVPNIVLWTIFLLVFIYYGRGVQGLAQNAAKETSPEEIQAKQKEREVNQQLLQEMIRLNNGLERLDGRFNTLEQLYHERFGNVNTRLDKVETRQGYFEENYIRKR